MRDATAPADPDADESDEDYLDRRRHRHGQTSSAMRDWGEGPAWTRRQALALLADGQDVLYATRIGDVIKIGYTRNLSHRLYSLKNRYGATAELVGFTFASRAAETALHKMLNGSRAAGYGRECYHLTPEVLAVVNAWRADYHREPLACPCPNSGKPQPEPLP